VWENGAKRDRVQEALAGLEARIEAYLREWRSLALREPPDHPRAEAASALKAQDSPVRNRKPRVPAPRFGRPDPTVIEHYEPAPGRGLVGKERVTGHG
jgi:hypothetical protein